MLCEIRLDRLNIFLIQMRYLIFFLEKVSFCYFLNIKGFVSIFDY